MLGSLGTNLLQPGTDSPVYPFCGTGLNAWTDDPKRRDSGREAVTPIFRCKFAGPGSCYSALSPILAKSYPDVQSETNLSNYQ